MCFQILHEIWSFDSLHLLPPAILAGVRSRPRWGGYNVPQTPLAGFRGITSMGGNWEWTRRGPPSVGLQLHNLVFEILKKYPDFWCIKIWRVVCQQHAYFTASLHFAMLDLETAD